MKLDDAQKKTVIGWIEQGLKLAEIQKKLGTEMGLNPTYMEVRFLVDDLKVIPKDPEPVEADDAEAEVQPVEAGEHPKEADDRNEDGRVLHPDLSLCRDLINDEDSPRAYPPLTDFG